MTVLFDRSVGLLTQALQFASRRHEILAENIANAATPGYRARDLVFDDALTMAARQAGAVETGNAGDRPLRVVYSDDAAPGADGNDVQPERQTARLAENLLYHSALVATLANRFNAVKQAIAGRS